MTEGNSIWLRAITAIPARIAAKAARGDMRSGKNSAAVRTPMPPTPRRPMERKLRSKINPPVLNRAATAESSSVSVSEPRPKRS